MTSASNPPPPPLLPRPSVFISYASEDRLPTRQLREALAAAGLDVWYDENELGGGDAWDQKIRRQIRECTYFMPVISATTEARREGYFRREWRLATERSLDMADDVMFLVPVVIDDTPETGARVPEKFLTLQWLRLPGGQPNAALAALAQRLLAHDHAQSAPPRSTTPPLPPRTPARAVAPGTADGPPPMPPFPVRPAERHHRPRYFAEVVWWVISAAWLIFKRLPRWLRIVLSIWFFFFVVVRCSRDADETTARNRLRTERPPKAAPAKGETDQDAVEAAAALKATAEKLDQAATAKDSSNLGAGLARAGAELARAVSTEINPNAPANGVLGVVPFDAGVTDPGTKKIAGQIFETVFGQLALARPGTVKPLPPDLGAADDPTLRSRAAREGDGFLLIGRWVAADDGNFLEVRLLAASKPAAVWTGRFPADSNDIADTARQITKGVVDTLPQR